MQQIMLLHAHLSDYELLRRVRGGNKECYEVLVRRYARLLYRIGCAFRMESAAAEAIAVAVFAEAYDRRDKMKEANHYRNYAALKMIERCKSLANSGFDSDDTTDEDTAVLVHTDKLNTLEKAIDVLPFSLKAPVILCSLESFSAPEAGQLLGLSEEVINTRMKLANSRMRGRLLKWYHAEDVFCCDSLCSDRVAAEVMAQL